MEAASPESTTIYARHRLRGVAAACGLFVPALVAHSHGANGLAIGLAAFAAAAAGWLVRRPRLRIGQDGLTVANLVRTYRIRWEEIAGFGYGEGSVQPNLTIRLRDGGTVHTWVVTDDIRSGYSPQQVEQIVADLRERLAHATGTVDRRLVYPLDAGAELRSRRSSLRLNAWMWRVLCLFFVVLGAVTAWKAASGLPRTYSRLRAHGVHATAAFLGCRVVDIRKDECRLRLTNAGRARTWTYPQNYPQFRRLPVGAPVAVLVDPNHPESVYTVHDVEVRYDAGFGVLGIFGIAVAAAGVLGLAWPVWWTRRLEAKIRRTGAEASPRTYQGG